MSHIHTDPGQYDFTASAYIIRTNGAEPVIVLHKHRKLNMYLQFGGHVELNENPWSAITHEVSEESGYKMSQLKLLQPNIKPIQITSGVLHPFPVAALSIQYGDLNHNHTDHAYAFVTNELPAGSMDDGESTEIRAFTATELAALPGNEIPANVREIGLYILEECLANWHEVDCSTFQTINPADN
jgi:hypothetical protein